MFFSYKKWIGVIILFVAVVIALAHDSSSARAYAPSQTPGTWCPSGNGLLGWAWSPNIGWVSFNSRDSTAGGGPYCVAIDTNNNLVGYAWSSNVGWIKFGSLSGFPESAGATGAGNAQISNGKLVGWARACSGTIKYGDPYLSQNDYPTHTPKLVGDCSTMTSRPDGWDGWIELDNTTHPLTYASNAFSGYAWGSDVVGWIQFMNVRTNAATVTPTAPQCYLNNTAGQPGHWTLSWGATSTSGRLVTCRSVANFPPDSVNSTSGTLDVTPSATTVYTMECTGEVSPVSTCSTTVTVPTTGDCHTNATCCPESNDPSCVSGPDGTPSGPIQMWLDADPAEAKNFTRVRQGNPVKINWKPVDGDTYGVCLPSLSEGSVNINLVNFGPTPRPNGNEYTKSDIPVGTYRFSLQCTSATTGSPIVGKTKATATATGQIKPAQDYMTIRVVNPSEAEF